MQLDPKKTDNASENLGFLQQLNQKSSLSEQSTENGKGGAKDWDEFSEMDGAFQSTFTPFIRQFQPPRSPPGKKQQLPYAEDLRRGLMRVEVPLAALVLLGCGIIAGQTLHDNKQLGEFLDTAEDVTNSIFIVEYFLRWYSRNLRPRYLFKWEMVVDAVSFLPFILRQMGISSFTGFTFLRLLRVLRLQRYLRDVESFERLIGTSSSVKPYQLEVVRVSTSLLTALFITAGLVYVVESPYNPNLSNYPQAFYFALTTLTTVGFGDVTPITPAGKAVVSGAILVGVGVVPYQISKVAETLVENTKRSVGCRRCSESYHISGANYCWRCGMEMTGGSSVTVEDTDKNAEVEAADYKLKNREDLDRYSDEDSDDYFS